MKPLFMCILLDIFGEPDFGKFLFCYIRGMERSLGELAELRYMDATCRRNTVQREGGGKGGGGGTLPFMSEK